MVFPTSHLLGPLHVSLVPSPALWVPYLTAEPVFFSRRNSPDACSVTKGGKMVDSPDPVGMSYSSYMEEKHMPPPNMTTSERRVIVPAGQSLGVSLWLTIPPPRKDGPSLWFTNLCQGQDGCHSCLGLLSASPHVTQPHVSLSHCSSFHLASSSLSPSLTRM